MIALRKRRQVRFRIRLPLIWLGHYSTAQRYLSRWGAAHKLTASL